MIVERKCDVESVYRLVRCVLCALDFSHPNAYHMRETFLSSFLCFPHISFRAHLFSCVRASVSVCERTQIIRMNVMLTKPYSIRNMVHCTFCLCANFSLDFIWSTRMKIAGIHFQQFFNLFVMRHHWQFFSTNWILSGKPFSWIWQKYRYFGNKNDQHEFHRDYRHIVWWMCMCVSIEWKLNTEWFLVVMCRTLLCALPVIALIPSRFAPQK